MAERFGAEWDVAFVSALRLHHAIEARPAPKPKRENLQVITPLAFPGERRFGFLHRANERLLLDAARRAFGGICPDAVVVNSPSLASVALGLDGRVLVYDLMDEFTRSGPLAEQYRENEARLFDAVDLVFTGTQSLYDDRKDRHARIEFLPGGCDFGHFAGGDPKRAPFGIGELKKPIVGFFGALNDRLDGALLERLAAESNGSLVLVGPRYRTAPPLPSGPNVSMPGPCPYERLPDVLAAFDVAIVPYRTDGDTRYVNPVKILEYFAGGKPVVSTALPDVKWLYGEAAITADDAGEFVSAIRNALEDSEAKRNRIEAGIALARARSWETTAGRLTAAIEERLAEIERNGDGA